MNIDFFAFYVFSCQINWKYSSIFDKITSLITKAAAIAECYPLFSSNFHSSCIYSKIIACLARHLHNAPGTLKIEPFAVLLSYEIVISVKK